MTGSNDAEVVAQSIWDDVTERMPEDLQKGRALVEARRIAIDIEDDAKRHAVMDALDALAVATFGESQVAPARLEPQPAPKPQRRSEAEWLESVEYAVVDAFSTTVDGSPERAEVLRQRALDNAERAIADAAAELGWFARRRLRKFAREVADKEAQAIITRRT